MVSTPAKKNPKAKKTENKKMSTDNCGRFGSTPSKFCVAWERNLRRLGARVNG